MHKHHRKLRKRQSPVAPGVRDLGTIDAPPRCRSSHVPTVLPQDGIDVLAQLLPPFSSVAGATVARVAVDSVERENNPLDRSKDLIVGGLQVPTYLRLERLQR